MQEDVTWMLSFPPSPDAASHRMSILRQALTEAFTRRDLMFELGLRNGSVTLEVWWDLSLRLAVITKVQLPPQSHLGPRELSYKAFVANVLYLDEPIALMNEVESVFSLERLEVQELVDTAGESLVAAHREFQRDLLIKEPANVPI